MRREVELRVLAVEPQDAEDVDGVGAAGGLVEVGRWTRTSAAGPMLFTDKVVEKIEAIR